MSKLIIFGNSGSGKSTLAIKIASEKNLAHLDLDTIAWLDTSVPSRAPIEYSKSKLDVFMTHHDDWVIEGCYADLLALVSQHATQMIFLNLSVDDCIENAKNRPWEPHKYPTKQAQDDNLEMLINWISEYTHRDDELSFKAHRALYEGFQGKKQMRFKN